MERFIEYRDKLLAVYGDIVEFEAYREKWVDSLEDTHDYLVNELIHFKYEDIENQLVSWCEILSKKKITCEICKSVIMEEFSYLHKGMCTNEKNKQNLNDITVKLIKQFKI